MAERIENGELSIEEALRGEKKIALSLLCEVLNDRLSLTNADLILQRLKEGIISLFLFSSLL